MTGFEDNSSFVWSEDGSVARSRRLRATDPFEVQTKLLLSKKPVYNCFVIHLHLKKNHFFHSYISIRCFKYPRPSSPRIGTRFWHCDVNITRLRKPMKIRPSVNSSIAGNRSMNCWPVNRPVLQLVGISLLTAKMLCIYFIGFIYEKKWWCITMPHIVVSQSLESKRSISISSYKSKTCCLINLFISLTN